MTLPDFGAGMWVMAVLAAMGLGISKAGLPGVSLFHVVVMAWLFPGMASTGIVVPMLVCGDILAVTVYRRHAEWAHVIRTLPPAVVGVALGWWIMPRVPGTAFGPAIGGIVLGLAAMQVVRQLRPAWFESVPHARWFAWSMGLMAGVTTMVANAAGPVMSLYFLAVALPKKEFVGTTAWFFLLINLVKVPFSCQLGLIRWDTLAFNLVLIPAIVVGLFAGKAIVQRVPQRLFDNLVLAFAVIAALRLMGVF